jgi:hypothetical protein
MKAQAVRLNVQISTEATTTSIAQSASVAIFDVATNNRFRLKLIGKLCNIAVAVDPVYRRFRTQTLAWQTVCKRDAVRTVPTSRIASVQVSDSNGTAARLRTRRLTHWPRHQIELSGSAANSNKEQNNCVYH